MDGAGHWLQFDEVDGSLCATVAGWRWKCIFKTRLRLLCGQKGQGFFGRVVNASMLIA